MKKWSKIIFILGVIIGIAGSSLGVPMAINVQGRIQGEPRPTTIRFTIYQGATNVWSTPYDVLTDPSGIPGFRQIRVSEEGMFEVILDGPEPDTLRPFPDFLTDDFSLGISIDGGAEMTPRQKLVAVPFAITSKNIRGDGTVMITRNAGAGDSANTMFVRNLSGTGHAIIGGYGNEGFVPGTPTNYGVLGRSNGIGAFGASNAEEGSGVRGQATGTNGIGVNGSGPTGGYFLGTQNYGVRAKGASGYASIYAEKDEDTAGNGINVRLLPPFGVDYAIYSYTAGNGNAFRGESDKGFGIWGKGSTTRGGIVGTTRDETNPTADATDFGVFGHGTFGLVGRGEGAAGIGVDANGGMYGVDASGSAVGVNAASSGVGVSGTSSSSSGAGVRAENSGTGPALEIGNGWIKASHYGVYSYSRPVVGGTRIRYPVGTITSNWDVRQTFVLQLILRLGMILPLFLSHL